MFRFYWNTDYCCIMYAKSFAFISRREIYEEINLNVFFVVLFRFTLLYNLNSDKHEKSHNILTICWNKIIRIIIYYRKQLHIFTHIYIYYDCFTQKTLVNMFGFSHLTRGVNNYNLNKKSQSRK